MQVLPCSGHTPHGTLQAFSGQAAILARSEAVRSEGDRLQVFADLAGPSGGVVQPVAGAADRVVGLA
ncbi:hypothetical protein [Nonomuraea dietziae]|uniref:hypothetical protein n=1 Tax=Nonomuraea dietziae TaxID=65515 RepID=UPI0033F74378